MMIASLDERIALAEEDLIARIHETLGNVKAQARQEQTKRLAAEERVRELEQIADPQHDGSPLADRYLLTDDRPGATA